MGFGSVPIKFSVDGLHELIGSSSQTYGQQFAHLTNEFRFVWAIKVLGINCGQNFSIEGWS